MCYHWDKIGGWRSRYDCCCVEPDWKNYGVWKKDDDVGHNDNDDLDHKSDEDDVEVFMENDFSHEADVDVQKDQEKD